MLSSFWIMTEETFKKWTENGNFTLSQDRILSISNDIAEQIYDTFTKKEACEVVTYWSLHASELQAELTIHATEKLFTKTEALLRKLRG